MKPMTSAAIGEPFIIQNILTSSHQAIKAQPSSRGLGGRLEAKKMLLIARAKVPTTYR